tara:strand:+ start:325 stop:972 length:648 start_codon:yes stop_codon:yes gene_type:complete
MIKAYDNQLVDNYIAEQIKLQSESTRKIQLENDKKQSWNSISKFSLIALAIGIALYVALSGIGNALSFEQIKKNFSYFNEGLENQSYINDEVSDDVLLDVEALLSEKSAETISNLPEETGSVVTNYVIFTHHDVSVGNVDQLTVGEQFPHEDASNYEKAWCYVELSTSSKISETFYFIYDAGTPDRTETDINQEVLDILGISFTQAQELKGLCGI